MTEPCNLPPLLVIAMNTESPCPICGKPLPANALEGLCPECRLKAGPGTGMAFGHPPGGPCSHAVKAPGCRAPLIAVCLSYAAYLAALIGTASWLPNRVASHFGLEGVANGWMSRNNFLILTGAVPVVIALVFAGIVRMAHSRLAAGMINIPNRAFWLAPERRALTAAIIRNRLAWLLSFLTLYFGGLHGLTVLANRSHPARLPMGMLLLLVVLFLLAVLIWTASLLTRFAETKD